MNKYLAAMAEELAIMRSGHAIPYHKVGMMVAMLTCIIFSVIFSHGVVFEGRVAVIDLDHSQLSQTLIEQLNSSPYIRVTEVYHAPCDPVKLIAHDRNLGVLYLPVHLEKELYASHRPMNIGYLADYSNEAQNAQVQENLNEIIGALSGRQAAIRLARLGLGETETQAALQPLSVKMRRLLDPVFSATNTTVVSFIYFFSSIFLGLNTLMIMGRMHLTEQFERCIADGPLCMIARLVPYTLIYMTAIVLPCALMIFFGQMRFAGNFLAFLPSLFLTGMSIGMFCMFAAWNAQDPGSASSFMILIVPPGFIVGGATMAIGFLPEWAYYLSHAFPLVWEFSFYRDFALRGLSLAEMLRSYGLYLGYLAILGLLICLRWQKSQKKISQPQRMSPLIE
ncbi:MAG: ABC transporter permease [Succinivibrio sp.]|nr:ABC transporter permease [Succinivibrio sp.]